MLSSEDIVQPDLVFVRSERTGTISDRGIEQAPDLVIEVLSRFTAMVERNEKRERYARFSVPEYWLVDIEGGQIEVFEMHADPATPTLVTETLEWRMAPGAPALRTDVQQLLRGLK